MISETNKLLEEICRNLSRGKVVNFVADAKIFQGAKDNEPDEIDLIKRILGDSTEVGDIEKSNLPELLVKVKECFEYIGDEGANPNRVYLSSEAFRKQLNELLEKSENLFSDSSGIYKFWLKEGHPFYPVFWDFAFLVKKNESNYVLIGSSSD